MPRSSDGVAGVARRLKDVDIARLDDIDDRISELQAAIKELRRERKQHVEQSWRRAKRILVHDVTPEDDATRRYVRE